MIPRNVGLVLTVFAAASCQGDPSKDSQAESHELLTLDPEARVALFEDLQRDLPVLIEQPEKLLPTLIAGLEAPETAVRHQAAYTLRAITGTSHGFSAFQPLAEQRVAVRSWRSWVESDTQPLHLPTLDPTTLIVDEIPGRIVGNDDEPPGRLLHTDFAGNAIADLYGMKMPYDAAVDGNGNYFVNIIRARAVYHVTPSGEILGEIPVGGYPCSLQLLENGHLLVAGWDDEVPGFVREFDQEGNVVWSLEDLQWPWKAQRLSSGNTLVADAGTNRVYEVNEAGEEVWAVEGLGPEETALFDFLGPVYATRLDDGNTLVSIRSQSRVVELNPSGEVVWELGPELLKTQYSAERLWNGNTLIADQGNFRVIEVDLNGTIVWEEGGFGYPAKAYRLP